jgi:uncharacterized membrane protein YfcA
MEVFSQLLLFLGTLAGNTIGSVVGGGSFIVQPIALAVGLTMHQAVALDVATSALASATGLIVLQRQGRLPLLKVITPAVFAAAAGAWIGSLIMTVMPAATLAWIFAAAAVAAAFLAGRPKPDHRATQRPIALTLSGLAVGCYMGISGAGAAIFAVALFSNFGGLSNVGALASLKLLYLTSESVAGSSYAWHGLLDWRALVPMALASALAGWLGASLILRMGDVRIGKLFRFAAIVFAVAMVWDLAR